MKRFSFLIFFFIPLVLFSQSDTSKGIKWTEGLTWEQVKQKAKSEGKNIFVDAYATWCVPCKIMDEKVYPKEEVGAYFNENFVSIKVQLDTSKHDNEAIRNWYKDAQRFQILFDINSFPTYLFFSSEGNILHKDIGGMNVKEFLLAGGNSKNPEKQYFTLLNKFQQGSIGRNELYELLNIAYDFKDKKTSEKAAKDYKSKYLDAMNDIELGSKENIRFISRFFHLFSSEDKMFSFLYNNHSWIDSLMDDKGLSERIITYIINKEEVNEKLWLNDTPKTDNPNWKQIQKNIQHKYNSYYSSKLISDAKVKWYSSVKDWEAYSNSIISSVKRVNEDLLKEYYLNNMAWEIFQHSKSKKNLSIALSWCDKAIQISSNVYVDAIDTKANLLFKLGDRQNAILWESVALKIAVERNDEQNIKIFQETLARMKANKAK